jgi:hypothetical protein
VCGEPKKVQASCEAASDVDLKISFVALHVCAHTHTHGAMQARMCTLHTSVQCRIERARGNDRHCMAADPSASAHMDGYCATRAANGVRSGSEVVVAHNGMGIDTDRELWCVCMCAVGVPALHETIFVNACTHCNMVEKGNGHDKCTAKNVQQ